MEADRRRLNLPSWWWWLPFIVLFAATLVDLLAAGMQPGEWTDPFSWKSITAVKQLNGTLTLSFRIEGQRLTAAYELTAPKDSRLVASLREAPPTSLGFGDYLGALYVNGRGVAFEPPTVRISDDGPNATVSIRSASIPLLAKRSIVSVQPWGDSSCCLPPAKAVIMTKGAQVFSILGTPIEQSSRRAVYSVGTGFQFFIWLTNPDRRKTPKAHPPTPVHVPDQRAMQQWHELVAESAIAPAGDVQLTIRIQGQSLSARYDVTVPESGVVSNSTDGQSLIEALRSHEPARDPENLAKFLGVVRVGENTLTFQPPAITALEDARSAKISMASEPMDLREEKLRVVVAPPLREGCCLPPTRVVVQTEDAQVQDPSERIAAQSADSTIFRDISSGLNFNLALTSFDERRTRAQPNSALLKRLVEAEVPGLSWALYWCAVCLPAGLFLWWRRKGRLGSLAKGSVPVVRALLAFYIVAMLASAVASFTGRWSLAVPLAEALKGRGLWVGGRPDASPGGPAVMLAAVALIWPAIARRQLKEGVRPSWPGTGPRQFATVLVDAVLASGLAVLVVVVTRQLTEASDATTPVLREVGPVGVAVSVLLAVGLLAVVTSLQLHMGRIKRMAALTVLLAFAAIYYLPDDTPISRLVRTSIVVGGGILVLFALARVGSHALRLLLGDHLPEPIQHLTHAPSTGPNLHDGTDVSWRSRWRRARGWLVELRNKFRNRDKNGGARRRLTLALIVLLLVVLALPTFGVLDNPLLWLDGWAMMSMADGLVLLMALCFGIVVLRELREVGSERSSLFEPRTRNLGILFALAVLFDPFARFFYLPVAVLTGLLVIPHWLLIDKSTPIMQGRISRFDGPREKLLHEAVAGGRSLKDGKDKQEGKGSEEPETQGNTAATPAKGQERSWEKRDKIRQTQSAALSLGPYDSPWENGKLFALYALWISMGWILLYFIPREMSLGLQGDRYLLLASIALILWNAAQWPALGFLLGYFYPAIRGPSGLWKGLWVAVAYVLPFLIVNIALDAVGQMDSWQPFIVWALQVFVTAVLTGFLAGEIRTLQQEGYGWADITNVHNFGGLAIWGSSLAVAVIGAIVTLLTTTIGQVVTSQLTSGPRTPGAP